MSYKDRDYGLQILILIVACLVCYFYGRSTGFDDGEEYIKSKNPSLASSILKAQEELEKAKSAAMSFYEYSLKEKLGEAYNNGWDDCILHYKFKMKPVFRDYYRPKIDYSKMSDEELLKPDLK